MPMDGISQGARKAVRLCTGCTVFRKEPGRRCGYVQDVRTGICSTAIARLRLLSRSTTYIHVSVLHCSPTCHPWQYAIPALPPSMAVVCHKGPRRQCDFTSQRAESVERDC